MGARNQIRVKRVYEPASPDDGIRILVDRLWPRGLSKDKCPLGAWLKDVAPSDELRKWFSHKESRWDGFQKRYHAELDSRSDLWKPLIEKARKGKVTLLFGARDEEHNNAVALKNYLEKRAGLGKRPRASALSTRA